MKIVAVTGGRADWSILAFPLQVLHDDPAFDLSIIATGQHLSESAGSSLMAVINTGIPVLHQIDIDLNDDTNLGIAKSTGMAVHKIAEALADIQPDMVLVLGDRYEILAACTAALLMQIPIIHLCGGDITEGAMDDAIRHAISKMAHIHFVTNEVSRERLIQMGENPEHIYNVGNPSLDLMKKTALMDRGALLEDVGLVEAEKAILVTCHPVTLDPDPIADCRAMLQALSNFPESAILCTGANADQGGQEINELLEQFAESHDNAVFIDNLGPRRYFSALAKFDVVVGNSSSGLYEAPSFQIPTVNIGERQKGRLRAQSVLDCSASPEKIVETIQKAWDLDCSDTKSPYGNGDSSEKICQCLKQVSNLEIILRKKFFEIKSQ